MALLRLVVGLADSLAAHRHFAESAFAQLKRDLTGSASSLQYLAAVSGLREQVQKIRHAVLLLEFQWVYLRFSANCGQVNEFPCGKKF